MSLVPHMLYTFVHLSTEVASAMRRRGCGAIMCTPKLVLTKAARMPWSARETKSLGLCVNMCCVLSIEKSHGRNSRVRADLAMGTVSVACWLWCTPRPQRLDALNKVDAEGESLQLFKSIFLPLLGGDASTEQGQVLRGWIDRCVGKLLVFGAAVRTARKLRNRASFRSNVFFLSSGFSLPSWQRECFSRTIFFAKKVGSAGFETPTLVFDDATCEGSTTQSLW